MPAASGGFATGASSILLGAALFLIYRTAPGWFADAAMVIQITAITLVLTRKWALRHRIALVVGLLAAMAMALNLPGLPPHAVRFVVAGVCHSAAYASLLIWFRTSLRPGREPVVTGIARRVRQTMPEKVVRYTHHVTIAWCLFFASQLLVSATLLLVAPEPVWSAFVNLLNLPLLAVMVLAEFGFRLILFRHEPRTNLIDTLSATRTMHAMPANRP